MAKKARLTALEKFTGESRNPTAQENRHAGDIGGRRVGGSGASAFSKGDAVSRQYRSECKQTVAASISVKGEWLEKITREARLDGKAPLLEIEIKGMTDPMTERVWVCMPRSEFQRLRGVG